MFSKSLGRRSSRRARKPGVEGLESRQLLVASLAPIPDVIVPDTVGLQVPVDGGTSAPNQTYTVSTDNDNLVASVATGPFLTIDVSHESAGEGDPAFTGSLTFQLFGDLTPLTVERISRLVRQGFYSGRNFHRIAAGFPDPDEFIVQGGSVNGDGTGEVNQPGFPFQDEFVQQLAFTGEGQLAMANSGRDTNSSQFFITTGQPRFLDYIHTIFGQLVEGNDVLTQMTQVQRDSTTDTPVAPILIDSATLSDASPDGVIHLDASNAVEDFFTNVTVTATDPTDGTTVSQTFRATVRPNVDADGNPIDERAFLTGLVDTAPVIGPNQLYQIQLQGVDPEGQELTYTVQGSVDQGQTTFSPVQNATATVDANGLVTVVPTPGFLGTISLLVGVRDQTNRPPATTLDAPRNFDYTRITLNVTDNFGGVREIGRVLTVTPPPRTDKGANTVIVDQVGESIQVSINGALSPIQPPIGTLDRVVVFGTRAGDTITVTPAVDPALAVTLDGGHGGRNVVQAGSAPSRLHGWFGRNMLTGGPADDVLIGRQGQTRFGVSGGNDRLFLGTIPVDANGNARAPSGTFFRFVGNRIVAVDPAVLAHQQSAQQRRAEHQARRASGGRQA